MLIYMNAHHIQAPHVGSLMPVGIANPPWLLPDQPLLAWGSPQNQQAVLHVSFAVFWLSHGHVWLNMTQWHATLPSTWLSMSIGPQDLKVRPFLVLVIGHVPAQWLPLPWPQYDAWWRSPDALWSSGPRFCSTELNWRWKIKGLFNERLFSSAEHSFSLF